MRPLTKATNIMNCNADVSLFCFIGRTMRSIMLILEEKFEQNGFDLNLPQFILLNILSNNDNLILEDLSKFLNKDKSAILRNVNHLENQHFIAKMTDKDDRRRKVLILTKKGMELLDSARSVEKELQDKLTNNLGDDNIDNFKNVLEQMKGQANSILMQKAINN